MPFNRAFVEVLKLILRINNINFNIVEFLLPLFIYICIEFKTLEK